MIKEERNRLVASLEIMTAAVFILSWIAAGGLVGLVDFVFNIQNGVYSASALDLAINGLLNAWCVGFGLFIIIALKSGAD